MYLVGSLQRQLNLVEVEVLNRHVCFNPPTECLGHLCSSRRSQGLLRLFLDGVIPDTCAVLRVHQHLQGELIPYNNVFQILWKARFCWMSNQGLISLDWGGGRGGGIPINTLNGVRNRLLQIKNGDYERPVLIMLYFRILQSSILRDFLLLLLV